VEAASNQLTDSTTRRLTQSQEDVFYSKTSTSLFVVQSQVSGMRKAGGVVPSDHRPVVTTFDDFDVR
jgi:hypothetical protein